MPNFFDPALLQLISLLVSDETVPCVMVSAAVSRLWCNVLVFEEPWATVSGAVILL